MQTTKFFGLLTVTAKLSGDSKKNSEGVNRLENAIHTENITEKKTEWVQMQIN